ncbi:hypothetical protein O181_092392 [Austropuccinia psidii MF-1]|uniref:Uncharacterized protein n=1 Tax=Austropuccinia psidii MF-1 TaxID=1389203 RepID=A0A9Q3IZD7_9BASI|nr:hypothetical protein [Austropuccinia psidii MF-1]
MLVGPKNLIIPPSSAHTLQLFTVTHESPKFALTTPNPIYQFGDPYFNSNVQQAEMRSRQGCFGEESLRLQGNQHFKSGCADHCHPGTANNHSLNVPTSM